MAPGENEFDIPGLNESTVIPPGKYTTFKPGSHKSKLTRTIILVCMLDLSHVSQACRDFNLFLVATWSKLAI